MKTGRLRLRGEREPPAGSRTVNLIFNSNHLRVQRRKNNTSYLQLRTSARRQPGRQRLSARVILIDKRGKYA